MPRSSVGGSLRDDGEAQSMMAANGSKANGDQRLGSLPLFLSLFLLLLAFFIFLNSISSFEAGKSDRVIASIRASFPGFGEGGEGAGILDADRIGAVEESLSARLTEAFRFTFPRLDLNIIDEGERIRVDIPLELLFVPGTTEPRAALQVLSSRLAKVLADPNAKQDLETRILFGYQEATGRIARDAMTLRRATTTIESMLVAGGEKRRMSVGLEPGHVSQLRFLFQVLPSGDAARRGEARP